MERYFDFKEETLTDLGVHADIFDADASVNGGSTWLLSESNLRGFDQFIEQALAEESSAEHPEWFGLTTDDDLKSIGRFETFDDADEACTFPTHWIFDEDSLRSFQVQIHNVLEATMGKMEVQFKNIVWDTDGAQVNLPTEATFEMKSSANVDLEGADALSAKFGFCVLSFDYNKEYYVWCDDDCENKTSSLIEAKKWRDEFLAEGRDSWIIDDNGNYITDGEVETTRS